MLLTVTGIAAALCGLLLLTLALRVSLLRVRHKVALGDGGVPELSRAIRAHGNTVEQVPVFLLQSACWEIVFGAGWLLITLAAVFVAARLLFAWGLTYLMQLILSLGLLVQLVTAVL